jgi:hypothetical protein
VKKCIFILLLSICLIGLWAQSENMQLLIEAHRAGVIKDGWKILEERYVDINYYRPLESDYYNLAKQYCVILFFDECVSANLTIEIGDAEIEPKYANECFSGVTRVITSFAQLSGDGRIVCRINKETWRKGYILIGVKS